MTTLGMVLHPPASPSPHAPCYRLGALQLGPWHMTSLGVATEMSARSSASRTPGAGGWVAGRTGTGRTGHDVPVAAGPAVPSDSGRHQAEMTNKALPFVCGGGRCQRSRCESFSDGQTTRQLISGISLGYCSTSKDWKEKTPLSLLTTPGV